MATKDTPPTFALWNKHLCTQDATKGIKSRASLAAFTLSKQQEIVDTLNAYVHDVTIVKYPQQDKVVYCIRGKPYLERSWSEVDYRYVTLLYTDIPRPPPRQHEHHHSHPHM